MKPLAPFVSEIDQTFAKIALSRDFTPEQKQMLRACVAAMADQFPDLFFHQIPSAYASPGLLGHFTDIARHFWAARQHPEASLSEITAYAIRCPFSEASIIALVMLYESQGAHLWRPATANTLDLKETA